MLRTCSGMWPHVQAAHNKALTNQQKLQSRRDQLFFQGSNSRRMDDQRSRPKKTVLLAFAGFLALKICRVLAWPGHVSQSQHHAYLFPYTRVSLCLCVRFKYQVSSQNDGCSHIIQSKTSEIEREGKEVGNMVNVATL